MASSECLVAMATRPSSDRSKPASSSSSAASRHIASSPSTEPDREVEPLFKVRGRAKDTLASSASLRRWNNIPTHPSQADDEVCTSSVNTVELGTRWHIIGASTSCQTTASSEDLISMATRPSSDRSQPAASSSSAASRHIASSSSTEPDREVEPSFKVRGRARHTLASSASLQRWNSIPTGPSQADDEVRALSNDGELRGSHLHGNRQSSDHPTPIASALKSHRHSPQRHW